MVLEYENLSYKNSFKQQFFNNVNRPLYLGAPICGDRRGVELMLITETAFGGESNI